MVIVSGSFLKQRDKFPVIILRTSMIITIATCRASPTELGKTHRMYNIGVHDNPFLIKKKLDIDTYYFIIC